ncbi:MAG: phosphotransacetylase family protein [Deltaproteobacteria bacterium]|nr:phosphotransacetylase family protein [Deltaproteobacteria bacterium]
MVGLYVTSFERYTGKDLVTIGVISRLRRDGFSVGYFKPFGHDPVEVGGTMTDKGALTIYKLFGLDDPMECICPVMVTEALIREAYAEGVRGLDKKVKQAFDTISQHKDIVVADCDNNFTEGSSFGLSGTTLISLLGLRALFVERYACDFCIDFLLEMKKVVGESMIGVVFNKVTPKRFDDMQDLVSLFLARNALQVFGALPLDRTLGAVGVKDLVRHLKGNLVCGKDRDDALVEGFLVGGMQVDKFITYMVSNPTSAVIVGGDRTDIQLVAVENGARCLILTGNLYPNETITARAEAQGVPVVVVQQDTFTAAKAVESIVVKLTLEDKKKIDHGIDLVDKYLDFERLYQVLGIRSAAA